MAIFAGNTQSRLSIALAIALDVNEWGLSVEAQSGATRNELRRAADVALSSWTS